MNESLINITKEGILNSNPFFNNLLIAIVWILLGLILGKILGKIVERILRDFQVDQAVQSQTGIKNNLHRVVGGIVSFAIYLVFFIIALNQVGITHLLLNVISIAVVIVLVISTILSIKDAVPNIIAYRQIVKTIKVGDHIKINSVDGEIIETTVFETKIKAKSGDEIHVPNRLFLKEAHIRRARKDARENKKKRKK